MKERLSRNLGLKLISLFCAFFVWLAVVNIANPITTRTKEVPVNVTNESILERSNLAYEIVGKKTAVISYQVKTKDAYKISASDFRAYADLSEMYEVTGAIPIKVEVLNNDALVKDVTIKSPEVLKIQTEELQTKPFQLQAKPLGEPAKEYVKGEVTMTPEVVYVKGPISLVGQISSVGIEFEIEGAASDVSGTAQPIFYDANGNSLMEQIGDRVKSLTSEVSYTMQMLKVKNVPLDLVTTGEVAEGYQFTGIECNVKEVPVAGLKSALASFTTLTVQSPQLSIAGATRDKTCEIDLTEYLPPNIQIAGMENTTVKVKLKVEPLEERTYTVDTKNIVLTGTLAQNDYEFASDTVELKVQGLKEDLDSLSADKMSVTLDVTGLDIGTHHVRASLELDASYEILEYPLCEILVGEKADEAGTNKTESTSESKGEGETSGSAEKAESSSESKAESQAAH